MKKTFLALCASASVMLTACGGQLSDQSAPAPVQTTVVVVQQAAPESQASTSSETSATQEATAQAAASSATQQCSNQSAAQAAQDAIANVPKVSTSSGWEACKTDTWDACKPLSWIVLNTTPASQDPTAQIALFEHGEFKGTATRHAYQTGHEVTRVTDNSISVTYSYGLGAYVTDHEPAGFFEPTTATFTATDKGIELSGTLPPTGPTKDSQTPAYDAATQAGAWNQAGGGIPQETVSLTSSESDKYYVVTPSGKTICVLSSSNANCLTKPTEALENSALASKAVSSEAPDNSLGNATTAQSNSSGPGQSTSGFSWVSDTALNIYTPTPQKIEYGQSVANGVSVCHIEQNGTTCWSTVSGHGFFINDSQIELF